MAIIQAEAHLTPTGGPGTEPVLRTGIRDMSTGQRIAIDRHHHDILDIIPPQYRHDAIMKLKRLERSIFAVCRENTF